MRSVKTAGAGKGQMPGSTVISMKKIFVFWDNSNIFISAKTVAAEREGGDAAYQVRIQ